MKSSQITTWTSTTPQAQWVTEKIPKKNNVPISATISVTDQTHQTWQGFGGCFNELGATALSPVSQAVIDQTIAELFHPEKGCCFSICRLPIGASDYATSWYSLNDTPGDTSMKHFSIDRDKQVLIPYIKRALKYRPDLALFASPWSPPAWMKHPPVYNFGTLVWDKKNLDAYALYFVKFVKAYADFGVSIKQIHVQNEVMADQKFPSCLWTGVQIRDFIRDHLGPAFDRHKLDTEIWLGTLNTEDYDGYPAIVLGDPLTRNMVAGVGLQWAGKGMVQRVAMSWPDHGLMQTENECGDGKNSWEYAGYIFNLLQHYITNGAKAYVYWNMILAPGGASTWGWKQNSMITIDPKSRKVIFNPEFYVMKHFSHFIPALSIRHSVSGTLSATSVAFERPDGTIVLIVRNPLATAVSTRIVAVKSSITVLLKPGSINTFCFS